MEARLNEHCYSWQNEPGYSVQLIVSHTKVPIHLFAIIVLQLNKAWPRYGSYLFSGLEVVAPQTHIFQFLLRPFISLHDTTVL